MKKSRFEKKTINSKSYFVKTYEERAILNKIVLIDEQLKNVSFPHFVPIEMHSETKMMQRWLEQNRPANYALPSDREQIFQVLTALHASNEQIAWNEFAELPMLTIKKKWRERIKNFVEQRHIIKPIIPNYYNDIKNQAITTYKEIEKDYFAPLTLCHGDVVHHNFLKVDNEWKIIDFDLAYLGHAEDELIHWMMRVLPFMEYDLMKLVEEIPSLLDLQHKYNYLLFPNEIMREALFYRKLPKFEQKSFLRFFHPFVEEAMHNRQKLKQQIEIISRNNPL